MADTAIAPDSAPPIAAEGSMSMDSTATASTATSPTATGSRSVEQSQRGDLLWAKIYGFPWWPSIVRGVRHLGDAEKPRLRVRFCHTDDDAELTFDNLAPFDSRPELLAGKVGKIKSKTVAKQWEAALAMAKARHASPPEDPGAYSEEEELAEEARAAAQESLWQEDGHHYLGQRVARELGDKKKKLFLATITKWMPPDGDDGALFHAVHDDGDEEDLEEHEAVEAIAAYQETDEAKKLAAEAEKAAQKEARALEKEARAEAKAAREARRHESGAMPARSALQLYKEEVEEAVGVSADPTMQVAEVVAIVQAGFDELPDHEKRRYEKWALEDEARFANDVRKREAARRKREEQKAKAAAAAPADAPADAPMEEAAATGAADAMEE